MPRLRLDTLDTSRGFSAATDNRDRPSPQVLKQLQGTFSAADIWHTVILHQLAERYGVIRRIDQEQVDIPDLFRVAAAIGRRGGVRPIR